MIKKFIFILNALQVMELLMAGKRLVGELYIDADTGKLTFKAFDRSKKRRRDRLIRSLEHGWVKESPARYKFFESIPKKIGMPSVVSVLERDAKVAKETLIDHEIINLI